MKFSFSLGYFFFFVGACFLDAAIKIQSLRCSRDDERSTLKKYIKAGLPEPQFSFQGHFFKNF
jgi:hypothetical protein